MVPSILPCESVSDAKEDIPDFVPSLMAESAKAPANAVARIKLRSTILDGKVVAVDENGIPRFQLLQRFQKQPTAPTLYYVFSLSNKGRLF